MFKRLLCGATAMVGALGLVVTAAAPAGACAGLVTPGGNVKLLRTATLAGYANGLEHYITSFTFEGGGAEFGSIVPLPANPSKIERAGDWTLQRLARETQPQPAAARATAAEDSAGGEAEVVQEARIDALDLTVLKGGAASVGTWAKNHGFRLTPDAPEVLDFYAARSPFFMAARFNADAARQREQPVGEGTPIHLTIPTANPWVPLRILSLGRPADEQIDADVYLLTERTPALLPGPSSSLVAGYDAPASDSLLADLRSDKGMGWIPASMWLTYLRVDGPARAISYDLAIDQTGRGRPSRIAAGLEKPKAAPAPTTSTSLATTTTVEIDTTFPVITTPVTAAPGTDTSIALDSSPASDHTTADPVTVLLALSGLVLVGLGGGWMWRRRAVGAGTGGDPQL